MNNSQNYLSLFLLSLFARGDQLKVSQLYHILNGKRTASTLYQALDAQLLPVFSLYERVISREIIEQLIQSFHQQGWIMNSGDSAYQLTAKGKEVLQAFFQTHHYPKQLNQLRYGNLTQAVWERMQLLTQVYSEKTYHNRQYTPVIKNYAHQRWIKQWMHHHVQSDAETAKQLHTEWAMVFKKLDPRMADSLALRLSGHNRIGSTHSQIMKRFNLKGEEMRLYFLDSLHTMFHFIEKNSSQLPIFWSILSQTNLETFEGLSQSTWETWSYIQKNMPLEKIARIRGLKIGTIREHLIELAVVKEGFQVQSFIPASIYTYLHEVMETTENVSYQEAKESFPQLPFYCYRLVQIERRRQNGDLNTPSLTI